MSAPITHIVLAEKVFPKYFSGKDKAKFFLGTSFPHIRRLAKLSREQTHLLNVTLDQIKSLDSYEAGFQFHSLVDQDMERFRFRSGIKSYFPESHYVWEAVKVFEDIILYDKVKNWEEILPVFDRVIEEELSFGTSREVVAEWHWRLQRGMAHKPTSTEEVGPFITGPLEISKEIKKVIEGVKDKEKVESLIEKYYDEFLETE